MFETTTQQCVLVGDDGTSYGNLPSTNQPNQPKKNPNDVPLPTIKTSGGSPPPGNSDCEHFEKGGLGIGTREVVLVMQNYGLLDDPFIMHRYEDHENDEDWRMFFFFFRKQVDDEIFDLKNRKKNMEPTNHPFRKENDLPNLHFWVSC